MFGVSNSTDEDYIVQDGKYRNYIISMEKVLKNFEYSTEWPDLISALTKLNKVLATYNNNNKKVFSQIPRRLLLSKRLNQCLHPSLPSGVHLKALECYELIFQILTNGDKDPEKSLDLLSNELYIYTAGLFTLSSYCSISIRPKLLHIYELFLIPLGPKLISCLSGLIPSILYTMELDSDTFLHSYNLLLQLKELLPTDFEPTFWNCIENNQNIRHQALQFIMKEKIYELNINSLIICLKNSNNILVQRSVLEILINNPNLNDYLQHTNLLKNCLILILKNDNSLNRRLFKLITNVDLHPALHELLMDKNCEDIWKIMIALENEFKVSCVDIINVLRGQYFNGYLTNYLGRKEHLELQIDTLMKSLVSKEDSIDSGESSDDDSSAKEVILALTPTISPTAVIAVKAPSHSPPTLSELLEILERLIINQDIDYPAKFLTHFLLNNIANLIDLEIYQIINILSIYQGKLDMIDEIYVEFVKTCIISKFTIDFNNFYAQNGDDEFEPYYNPQRKYAIGEKSNEVDEISNNFDNNTNANPQDECCDEVMSHLFEVADNHNPSPRDVCVDEVLNASSVVANEDETDEPIKKSSNINSQLGDEDDHAICDNIEHKTFAKIFVPEEKLVNGDASMFERNSKGISNSQSTDENELIQQSNEEQILPILQNPFYNYLTISITKMVNARTTNISNIQFPKLKLASANIINGLVQIINILKSNLNEVCKSNLENIVKFLLVSSISIENETIQNSSIDLLLEIQKKHATAPKIPVIYIQCISIYLCNELPNTKELVINFHKFYPLFIENQLNHIKFSKLKCLIGSIDKATLMILDHLRKSDGLHDELIDGVNLKGLIQPILNTFGTVEQVSKSILDIGHGGLSSGMEEIEYEPLESSTAEENNNYETDKLGGRSLSTPDISATFTGEDRLLLSRENSCTDFSSVQAENLSQTSENGSGEQIFTNSEKLGITPEIKVTEDGKLVVLEQGAPLNGMNKIESIEIDQTSLQRSISRNSSHSAKLTTKSDSLPRRNSLFSIHPYNKNIRVFSAIQSEIKLYVHLIKLLEYLLLDVAEAKWMKALILESNPESEDDLLKSLLDRLILITQTYQEEYSLDIVKLHCSTLKFINHILNYSTKSEIYIWEQQEKSQPSLDYQKIGTLLSNLNMQSTYLYSLSSIVQLGDLTSSEALIQRNYGDEHLYLITNELTKLLLTLVRTESKLNVKLGKLIKSATRYTFGVRISRQQIFKDTLLSVLKNPKLVVSHPLLLEEIASNLRYFNDEGPRLVESIIELTCQNLVSSVSKNLLVSLRHLTHPMCIIPSQQLNKQQHSTSLFSNFFTSFISSSNKANISQSSQAKTTATSIVSLLTKMALDLWKQKHQLQDDFKREIILLLKPIAMCDLVQFIECILVTQEIEDPLVSATSDLFREIGLDINNLLQSSSDIIKTSEDQNLTINVFQFMQSYLTTQDILDNSSQIIQLFLKDGLWSNFSTVAQCLLAEITYELYNCKTWSKIESKEILDYFHKLLDSTVVPRTRDMDNELRVLRWIEKMSLKFDNIIQNEDKLNNVVNYLFTFIKGRFPASHYSVSLKVVVNLTKSSFRKSWKKEAFESLLDSGFFHFPEPSACDSNVILDRWKVIMDSIFMDKTNFNELLSRVSVPQTGSLNPFTSKDVEYESRAMLLKRLGFVIYSSEKDSYSKFITNIQERLAEAIKMPTLIPSIQSKVLLVFRVLLLRLSPSHLAALWPIILHEVLIGLNQLETTDMLTKNAELLDYYLNLFKLIEVIINLNNSNIELFNCYRWSFIGPSTDSFTPHLTRLSNLIPPPTTPQTSLMRNLKKIESIKEVHSFLAHPEINITLHTLDTCLSIDFIESKNETVNNTRL